MSANTDFALQPKEEIRKAFTQTISFAQSVFGDRVFRLEKALNAAVFDAVTVGLAKRLDRGPINDTLAAQKAYQSLIANEEFVSKCRRATANEENVRERIRLACAAFANIE